MGNVHTTKFGWRPIWRSRPLIHNLLSCSTFIRSIYKNMVTMEATNQDSIIHFTIMRWYLRPKRKNYILFILYPYFFTIFLSILIYVCVILCFVDVKVVVITPFALMTFFTWSTGTDLNIIIGLIAIEWVCGLDVKKTIHIHVYCIYIKWTSNDDHRSSWYHGEIRLRFVHIYQNHNLNNNNNNNIDYDLRR